GVRQERNLIGRRDLAARWACSVACRVDDPARRVTGALVERGPIGREDVPARQPQALAVVPGDIGRLEPRARTLKGLSDDGNIVAALDHASNARLPGLDGRMGERAADARGMADRRVELARVASIDPVSREAAGLRAEVGSLNSPAGIDTRA